MINAKEAKRISNDSRKSVLESDEDIVYISEKISERASQGRFETEVTVLLNKTSNDGIRPSYVCKFLQENGYCVSWFMTGKLHNKSFPVYKISWEDV